MGRRDYGVTVGTTPVTVRGSSKIWSEITSDEKLERSFMNLDGETWVSSRLKWADCCVMQVYIECEGCKNEEEFIENVLYVNVEGVEVDVRKRNKLRRPKNEEEL